jgi:hypothetical protein
VFTKNQDGKDSDVRQLRSAATQAVKKYGSKISSFKIDDGIVTIVIDDEEVASKLTEDLKRLEGANVTVVGSALEAFIGRLNSQRAAGK